MRVKYSKWKPPPRTEPQRLKSVGVKTIDSIESAYTWQCYSSSGTLHGRAMLDEEEEEMPNSRRREHNKLKLMDKKSSPFQSGANGTYEQLDIASGMIWEKKETIMSMSHEIFQGLLEKQQKCVKLVKKKKTKIIIWTEKVHRKSHD